MDARGRQRVSAGAWAAWLAACLLWLAPSLATALEAPEVSRTERAEVRLLADHAVAAPGGTVALALHQALVGKWHTYWKNPGDSGLAPTIAWEAPEGVEIGPIEWPRPERIPFPPLVNYGFSGEAILIQELRLPADWPAGEPVRLSAQADWLICEDICVPESQAFTLEIPTAEAPVPAPAAAEVVARGRADQPVRADLDFGWRAEGEEIVLAVAAPEFAGGALEEVYFFPEEWGVVAHSAEQRVRAIPGGLEIRAPKGDAWLTEPVEGPIPGVLAAVDRTGGAPVELALAVTAAPGLPEGAAAAPLAGGGGAGLGAVLAAAGFAFLGGLILNLMPCVFPVLALKAVSVSRHADAPAERQAEGAAYAAGVIVSFLAVAGVLIALKAAGAAVGWGFQLQEPIVVALLAYVLFAVGLNLSGVYEVPGRLAGIGGGLADRGGRLGSFFTGVLAVVVASPCTAPFMGAAVGYALTQSAWVTLTVFLGLAIGFALPLTAVALSPGLARALPRPGVWMERMRQALAFPMYLAAAWLLWVLGKLAGVDALFAALVGLVLMALAAWALGSGRPASAAGRRAALVAGGLALLGSGAALAPSLGPGSAEPAGLSSAATEAGAEPWDPARLAALRAEGRPVFVNFTADWCISCKVNERVALSGGGFRDTLAETGTVYMVGDWTRRDGEILAVLERHGRAGVPLYLVYPAGGGAPEVLPQILTERLVRTAIESAAGPRAAALDPGAAAARP